MRSDLVCIERVESIDQRVGIEALGIEPLADAGGAEQEILPRHDLLPIDCAPARIVVTGIDAKGIQARLHDLEIAPQHAGKRGR